MKTVLSFIAALIITATLSAGTSKMYNAEVMESSSKAVLLKDLTKEGKTVIFAFVSEWCLQCQVELDSLNKILPQLEEKNTTVIAVALNSARNQDKIQARIAEKGWKMKFLYDNNDEAKNIYRISTLPKTMVVNNDGKIVYEGNGYNKEKFNTLIQITQEVNQAK
jgi:peroxiredoxin